MYEQVSEYFRQAILSGSLEAGRKLPSSRHLAGLLKLSRITIVGAFERLQGEGYLETRIGSGTFVSSTLPDKLLRVHGAIVVQDSATSASRLLKLPDTTMDLLAQQSTNRPIDVTLRAFWPSMSSLETFPLQKWAAIVANEYRKSSRQSLAYGNPMGYGPLREAIADYVRTSRGVNCTAEQIMIVNGSQQGLTIAARTLIGRGAAVWMEDPGYPGAKDVFRAVGAIMIPVPVDGEGLSVQVGIQRGPGARMAYVTPSHQFPLGITMTVRRREELLGWALQSDSWIVEDDYDSEYRFDSPPVPALQGMDGNSRVIYLGTFSKVIFPSLRVGYLVLPKDLIPAFRATKEAEDLFTSVVDQAALTEFMRQGDFSRHLRRMRHIYGERRRCMTQALRARFTTSEFAIEGEEAGMTLLFGLPDTLNDLEVSSACAERRISISPLSLYYLERERCRSGLVLGYGGTDQIAIEKGVEILWDVVRCTQASAAVDAGRSRPG